MSAHRGQDGPVVAGRGLFKTYRQGADEIRALNGVDVAVAPGELLAVTGASGSGKSTLLHILGGLDRPDAGEVMIERRNISSLKDEELSVLRRRRVGLVLQFFNLLPTLSAAENVAFPMLLDGVKDAVERALPLLEQVGLGNRAGHRPGQLSGGEQQRVALARALVTKPAVVLADEPTGNLDSASGSEILALLRRSADEGQAIFLVTHDERVASYADRVLRLADGLLEERPADPMAAAPLGERRTHAP